MRKILSFLLVITIIGLVFFDFVDAAVRVKGYYRKDGTYVSPYYRSNPDGNPYNNWSFPGNVNPYTGAVAPGNPDTYLKNYYSDSSSTLSPLLNNGFSTSGNASTSIEGGYFIGSSLFCNSGYYKINSSCKPAPNHAIAHGGDSFYCDSGYYKVGDNCEKVPDNAYLSGSSWECKTGYKKVENKCEAPQNGKLVGSLLVCNNGYISRNEKCISYNEACKIQYGAGTYAIEKSCFCDSGYGWIGEGGGKKCMALTDALCVQSYGDKYWYSSEQKSCVACTNGVRDTTTNQCISYTQDCQHYYGLHVIGSPGNNNNSSCSCSVGYEWNKEQTQCLKQRAPLSRTLKMGVFGEDVGTLQEILSIQGLYAGTTTNYFDEQTKLAVEKFQEQYGIDKIGIVGPKTRASLNIYINELRSTD